MKQRPQRLVQVGSVLVDILLSVPHLPERGGDVLAQQAQITTGGGFNVLLAARRLGMPVLCASRIGDGPMGNRIKTDLQAADIALAFPTIHAEDSGFDVGLIESDAERTFITSPGTESRLHEDDLRSIPLRSGDAVYVSGYDLCYPISGPSLEQWLPDLPADCWLVLDPGPLVAEIPAKRLQRVLGRTDIISLNERELTLLTSTTATTSASLAAQTLATKMGDDAWVVARVGPRGCWLTCTKCAARHYPARSVQALDTTGAGDAHVAALLARLHMGDDIYRATQVATIAASLAVTKRGPASGPTQEELQQALGGSIGDERGM